MTAPLLVLPYPAIDPVLLQLGPLALRWYSLAYIAGLATGWLMMRGRIAQGQLWGTLTPPPLRVVDDFVLIAALGIIIGGRAGYVIFYDPAFFWQNPARIFAVWTGGMSFHGGFAGFVIAAFIHARARKVAALTLLDLAALVAPVGLFFGRIANFINGELWGRHSDLPWAMVFPAGGPGPRHPSQLYEALLEGVVLGIVLWIAQAGRVKAFARPGLMSGLFAAGYAVARIASEFFRAPDIQIGFLFGGLTLGMLLSIPMLLAGVFLIMRAVQAGRAS